MRARLFVWTLAALLALWVPTGQADSHGDSHSPRIRTHPDLRWLPYMPVARASDPVRKITSCDECKFGGICLKVGADEACVCNGYQPRKLDPVCASDGRIYLEPSALATQSCLMQKNIEQADKRTCNPMSLGRRPG